MAIWTRAKFDENKKRAIIQPIRLAFWVLIIPTLCVGSSAYNCFWVKFKLMYDINELAVACFTCIRLPRVNDRCT